jgi:hypothetical protein
MTAKRLTDMSDDELEALTSDELLAELDPDLAEGLRDIWSRTGSISGNWADELIADRRDQVSSDRAHAK